MASKPEHDPLIPPVELSDRLGLTPQLLADWRSRRVGPAYLKLGHRTVRYRSSDVDKWLASRKVGGAA